MDGEGAMQTRGAKVHLQTCTKSLAGFMLRSCGGMQDLANQYGLSEVQGEDKRTTKELEKHSYAMRRWRSIIYGVGAYSALPSLSTTSAFASKPLGEVAERSHKHRGLKTPFTGSVVQQ